MSSCVGCGTELDDLDRDPNGEQNCTCARCRAELNHDFTAEPDVTFDRRGRKVKITIEQIQEDYPEFKVRRRLGRQRNGRFWTLFHADHIPSHLGTAMDCWTLGGIIWCIKHFQSIKDEGRHWTSAAFSR